MKLIFEHSGRRSQSDHLSPFFAAYRKDNLLNLFTTLPSLVEHLFKKYQSDHPKRQFHQITELIRRESRAVGHRKRQFHEIFLKQYHSKT